MIFILPVKLKLGVLAIFAAISLLPCASQAWTAKVLDVADGDIISVLHNGRTEAVRLYGIDCPEPGQPFCYEARRFTVKVADGRTVHVSPTGTDSEGRTLAWVYAGWLNLNLELVKNGFAWHDERYSPDSEFEEAELGARRTRAGLWKDVSPVPPWDFRQTKGETAPTGAEADAGEGLWFYRGDTETMMYHRPGCSRYGDAGCTKAFISKVNAENRGYLPCELCNP